MPYGSVKELPKEVQSLPAGAKKIFMGAFNSAFKEYGETRAFKIAWSAVGRKYTKKGSEWVAKSSDEMTVDSTEIEMEEIVAFDAADIRITNDGYLQTSPRIARTGIQIYRGSEVGAPDMETVRVYRPEAEVFSKDTLASFAYRPVTNDHPDENVTSKNWKKLAVGQLSGDVARDGEFMRIPMAVMDQKTIDDVNRGKSQLSAGYRATLEWGEGKTPTGEIYDAMQRGIRANHVAIVSAARGGSKLRIGDDEKKSETYGHRRRTMPDTDNFRTFTIDGLSVEMSDRDGQVVERAIKKHVDDMAAVRATADAAKTAFEKQVAELTTQLADARKQVETKDAELATTKKQLDDSKLKPEQIDALVTQRLDSVAKAKVILGDKLVVKDQSDFQIRRQVVDSRLGEVAKGWTDDQITASFNTLTAGIKIGDRPANGSNGSVFDVAHALSNQPVIKDDRETAYDEYVKDVSNAWQTNKPKSVAA
jgi:cation transport regulator ChaB